MLCLDRIILGWKIEILSTRHQDSAGLDRSQRCRQIALENWPCADVSGLPCRQFAQQIISIPVFGVIIRPIIQQFGDALIANVAVSGVPVKCLRKGPTSIDPTECPQPLKRQTAPDRYRLEGGDRRRIQGELPDIQARLQAVQAVVDHLGNR